MLELLIVGAILAIALGAWACCRLAGQADEQAEQIAFEQAQTDNDREVS